MKKLRIIDSHTAGEPTRLVIEGGPDLGAGPLHERLARLQGNHDQWRRGVVNEPRGSDVLVGAWLVEPHAPDCAAGVIFFNDVGYLGMCGHGTIGLIVSLAYLGRITTGVHRIDTPVGQVSATLHEDGSVSVENVPAYRLHAQVEVYVAGIGVLRGDVAWGGNWFFLIAEHGQDLVASNTAALMQFTMQVREALAAQGITGTDGASIDHIELFGEGSAPGLDSRNFVLCSGNAYDRSPCGTGTSAKVACLAADGKLAEGAIWRQESIVGSSFEASYARRDGQVIPTIHGRAHLTADAQLLFDETDPFAWGIVK